MARVGLNLIYLVPGETGGMEVYARELIPALRAERPDLEITTFLNREAAAASGPWHDVDRTVTVPVSASSRFEWVRGEQQLLPRLARRAGVDVLHSLGNTAPAWGRFRRVVTIHDLHYKVAPEAHFGVRGLGMRALVPLAVRTSHRVIVVSEHTGRDVERLLRVPPSKIDVAPQGNAAAPSVAPLPAGEVRARHGVQEGRRLLLAVSAKRPHKNLMRLLGALALIAPERRPVLVIPGYPTPHEAQLRAHAAAVGVAGDVRFPAWVDDAELEGLYAAADAFVFPSLYEGFGLPVLEAMGRGVPVATSDRGSLPEVAGDAALLFDPRDEQAIAAAIARLLEDPAEAERLRTAGRERAARFTWAATARATGASYDHALER